LTNLAEPKELPILLEVMSVLMVFIGQRHFMILSVENGRLSVQMVAPNIIILMKQVVRKVLQMNRAKPIVSKTQLDVKNGIAQIQMEILLK
jgi:hypothetical protein